MEHMAPTRDKAAVNAFDKFFNVAEESLGVTIDANPDPQEEIEFEANFSAVEMALEAGLPEFAIRLLSENSQHPARLASLRCAFFFRPDTNLIN